MANDEEVDDFGGLESTEPLAEDARAEEQPVSPTGAGEDPVAAAAPSSEGTSVVSAPAAPSQVAG